MVQSVGRKQAQKIGGKNKTQQKEGSALEGLDPVRPGRLPVGDSWDNLSVKNKPQLRMPGNDGQSGEAE
ncbi:MAG: hypothetical protein V2B13_14865 [Pseudomonadota bacterium]